MFWIPEAEEFNLLDAKSKVNFDGIINDKRYTVKDSTLTYRQANSMSNDNILPEDKNRENGWRKFSLKELIYIELVLALKKLGLRHDQLRNVWDSFFLDFKDIKEKGGYWKRIGEDSIALAMGHVDMILTVTENGDITYLHPAFFTLFYPTTEPFVFVSISSIVNRVMRRLNREEFTPKCTIETINHVLSDKEEKVLCILRNNQYKTVKLTKKDGEVNVVHAEKENGTDNYSVNSLVDVITRGRYQKVSVTQRDGKIVSISQEDTIKV